MNVKAAGLIAFAAGAGLGAFLSKLAEQEGISVSELVRRALLAGLPGVPPEVIQETQAIGKNQGRPRTRTGQSRWSALPERDGAGARPGLSQETTNAPSW